MLQAIYISSFSEEMWKSLECALPDCSLNFLLHRYEEGIQEFAQGFFLSSKYLWKRKLNTDLVFIA